MKTTLTTLGIFLLVLAGCAGQKKTANDFIQENIDNAVAQETLQTDIIEKSGKILNPRTINKDGSIHYVPIDDWCSGFFPGNIWYTYELTGDKKWLPLAEKYTEALDSVQYLTWHHDVGFMIGSSYLNGYRFANKEEYKPVIIQTAKSLSTRFRPGAGVIQSWARGQAWALYGYTMCYRYTHDAKYLAQAEKVYNFIFGNKNLPEDLVPYWDFDAPKIPNEPRDASAAACTASALYELSTYVTDKGYKETADRIMESLASPAYRAEVGTNGNFILMHSVGSIPHGAEIDVPLNYADYYFLEALKRKRDLEK